MLTSIHFYVYLNERKIRNNVCQILSLIWSHSFFNSSFISLWLSFNMASRNNHCLIFSDLVRYWQWHLSIYTVCNCWLNSVAYTVYTQLDISIICYTSTAVLNVCVSMFYFSNLLPELLEFLKCLTALFQIKPKWISQINISSVNLLSSAVLHQVALYNRVFWGR